MRQPPPAELRERRAWIDTCFAADTAEEIVRRLFAHGDPAAKETAETLLAKSPTAVKVALTAVRRARGLGSLEQALDQEYRVSCAALAAADLVEGIRAQVIDKDRRPRWNPPTLSDVTDADVRRFFTPLGDRELGLGSGRTDHDNTQAATMTPRVPLATQALRIRPGGPADAPAILRMLDAAVAWMNARGNTEQWGTIPYSRRPDGPSRVERYTTENTPYIAEWDGTPVGAMVLDSGPSPQMPIPPADEPERYVRLLVSDRHHAGHGIGAALLSHAVDETRRAGVGLLRVDCWAGDGGRLVAFYERNGFTPTTPFVSGTWPGQVLARRLD